MEDERKKLARSRGRAGGAVFRTGARALLMRAFHASILSVPASFFATYSLSRSCKRRPGAGGGRGQRRRVRGAPLGAMGGGERRASRGSGAASVPGAATHLIERDVLVPVPDLALAAVARAALELLLREVVHARDPGGAVARAARCAVRPKGGRGFSRGATVCGISLGRRFEGVREHRAGDGSRAGQISVRAPVNQTQRRGVFSDGTSAAASQWPRRSRESAALVPGGGDGG